MLNIHSNDKKEVSGIVKISGAKNAILPILCASTLSDNDKGVKLFSVPVLKDVDVLRELLSEMNYTSDFNKENEVLRVYNNSNEDEEYILSQKSTKIRYALLLIGAALANKKKIVMPLPGGCNFSKRPIDLHIEGLKALGAIIDIDSNGIMTCVCKSDKGLIGAEFRLKFPSVGATENLIIAASKAEGSTKLTNIAIEPEIEQLVEFLNKLGADIVFNKKERVALISGKQKLDNDISKVKINIIPDRIEAATYIVLAALLSKNGVKVKNVPVQELTSFFSVIREIGVDFKINGDDVCVKKTDKLTAVNIKTGVHPEFPTDIQPLIAVLLTQAEGESTIQDTIYPTRFQYVKYLNEMNAKIENEPASGIITIQGPTALTKGQAVSEDLRCGAAMILAGLITKDGITTLVNEYQVMRGYSKLIEKLAGLNLIVEEEDLVHVLS